MAARIATRDDLRAVPVIGYIPDMIFDKELDYLSETGLSSVQLASNSASVQLMLMRAGGGVGIAHDFAMPFAPELRPVLREAVSLTAASTSCATNPTAIRNAWAALPRRWSPGCAPRSRGWKRLPRRGKA